MEWPFAKYVGCGNDFIFFDNRTKLFPSHNKPLIQRLCHRQAGIGADGIILLDTSSKADFSMRIFNADGSEAEMCGNGIRCLMRYLQHLNQNASQYKIETLQRLLTIAHNGPDIRVEMGKPSQIKWNIPLQIKDQHYQVHHLDTGVPHIVLFVKNIIDFDLSHIGPIIRHHSLFSPKGTNVNIVQVESDHLKIRTYERGVEAETLACGTGATAAALAAAHQYKLKSPIIVQTALQDELTIGFQLKDEQFSAVTMSGPAHRTYQGTVDIT